MVLGDLISAGHPRSRARRRRIVSPRIHYRTLGGRRRRLTAQPLADRCRDAHVATSRSGVGRLLSRFRLVVSFALRLGVATVSRVEQRLDGGDGEQRPAVWHPAESVGASVGE